MTAGGPDQCDDVVAELVTEAHVPGCGHEREDVLARGHCGERVDRVRLGLIREDGGFLRSTYVAKRALHGESVHLCFR